MSPNPYASPATAPGTGQTAKATTMRIRRIGVLQLAKLMAVFNLLFTAVLIVPMMFFIMLAGGKEAAPFGAIGLLILPFIYAIAGFIVGAISAFIYNLVASWVGGLELELQRA